MFLPRYDISLQLTRVHTAVHVCVCVERGVQGVCTLPQAIYILDNG